MVRGKISADLRIEYSTQEMEIARADLELATRHYHAGHPAEKARAGFQLYARPEDTAGLRRVRDEREITVAILSFELCNSLKPASKTFSASRGWAEGRESKNLSLPNC